MSYDVIIAGLGAMGSATAYHLAGTHQKVLGLDRYRPPHTLGSSHGGSRIIRETSFEHPRYVPLARRAYDCWREIERQSGVSLLQITGGLFAGPATGLVGRTRESAVTHGVVHEMLSAGEMQRRWPGFHPDAEMVGLYEAGAGVLDPERCIATCLDGARRSAGIDLRLDEPLERWEPDGAGVVVTTPRGRYRAGKLVLALGPWMLEVVGPLGVALSVERVVQHWFATRDAARVPAPVHLWEYGNGEVFYGFPPRNGEVKVAIHHGGRTTTVDSVDRAVAAEEVAAARRPLERFLGNDGGNDWDYRRSAVCLYTNTPGGDFLIDVHPEWPQVILASPCSGFGFKFASAIGAILAQLVTTGATDFDLAPFAISPARGIPPTAGPRAPSPLH